MLAPFFFQRAETFERVFFRAPPSEISLLLEQKSYWPHKLETFAPIFLNHIKDYQSPGSEVVEERFKHYVRGRQRAVLYS